MEESTWPLRIGSITLSIIWAGKIELEEPLKYPFMSQQRTLYQKETSRFENTAENTNDQNIEKFLL